MLWMAAAAARRARSTSCPDFTTRADVDYFAHERHLRVGTKPVKDLNDFMVAEPSYQPEYPPIAVIITFRKEGKHIPGSEKS
jgi:hypothetical protein